MMFLGNKLVSFEQMSRVTSEIQSLNSVLLAKIAKSYKVVDILVVLMYDLLNHTFLSDKTRFSFILASSSIRLMNDANTSISRMRYSSRDVSESVHCSTIFSITSLMIECTFFLTECPLSNTLSSKNAFYFLSNFKSETTCLPTISTAASRTLIETS